MFVVEYQIGSFVRQEQIEDREAAFKRARAIWASDGCEYVLVSAPDGEQIFVKRSSKTPSSPQQQRERRQRAR
jgi:hypothetical protein